MRVLTSPRRVLPGGAKCCQVAGAGPSLGTFGEVGVDAGEIDRGSGELVLEAGLRQAPVAGSAQAMGEDALGDGAFDAGADLVAGLPLVGLLQRPGLVECVVVVPGPQRDLPALGFGTEIPGLPRLVMRFP